MCKCHILQKCGVYIVLSPQKCGECAGFSPQGHNHYLVLFFFFRNVVGENKSERWKSKEIFSFGIGNIGFRPI